MNINKFTQNSIQAINNCEKLAYEYGHQEIDTEHLVYSLITIDDSLIKRLLQKMGINTDVFLAQVKGILNKRTKVSGGQVYISDNLNRVLLYAEDEAKNMGDAYVSVEHLFLSVLRQPGRNMGELLREFGITR